MAKIPYLDDFYLVTHGENRVGGNDGETIGRDHRAQDAGALVAGEAGAPDPFVLFK